MVAVNAKTVAIQNVDNMTNTDLELVGSYIKANTKNGIYWNEIEEIIGMTINDSRRNRITSTINGYITSILYTLENK